MQSLLSLARTRSLPSLALLVLVGCTSGDGNGSKPSGALFDGYAATTFSLPVLAPLTPLAPVGADPGITHFSVSPALPVGIALDPVTGVLSGTPAALAPSKAYKIRATDGSVKDVETITLEVRGPLVELASDHPLVRTTLVAGTPTAPATGGTGLTGTAPVATDLVVTAVDAAPVATSSASAVGAVPTLSADRAPSAFDSTADFIALVSVDASELSADPWTLTPQAPNHAAPLTPTAGGFRLDTSTTTLADGELQFDVALASPSFGPFDSTPLPTAAASLAPLSTVAFTAFDVAWTRVGDAFYFGGSTTGGSGDLFRYDPLSGTLEQVVDLNPATTRSRSSACWGARAWPS